MTRQPSTRTAEPRTPEVRCLLMWPTTGTPCPDSVTLDELTGHLHAHAIAPPWEAEAAAPAGLDVEALAEAVRRTSLAHYRPEASASYAGRLAAEYARLLQEKQIAKEPDDR